MSIPDGSEIQELIFIEPLASGVYTYQRASVPPAFVALPEPTVIATSLNTPGTATRAVAQESPSLTTGQGVLAAFGVGTPAQKASVASSY